MIQSGGRTEWSVVHRWELLMRFIIDRVTHLFHSLSGRSLENACSEHSLVVNLLIISIDRSQLLVDLL